MIWARNTCAGTPDPKPLTDWRAPVNPGFLILMFTLAGFVASRSRLLRGPCPVSMGVFVSGQDVTWYVIGG